MTRRLALLAAAWLAAVGGAGAAPAPPPPPAGGDAPAPRLLDAFEDASAWQAIPASGVEMKLSTEPGLHGRALRVDFNFVKGGGYAVLHRALDLPLPPNYQFTFQLRGACKPNNLEFKLADASGENVWWCNRRDVTFPEAWTRQTIRKRHISYAWGPLGGGELTEARSIEFAITAGQGGQGTVWFDDLELTELPPPGELPPPLARGSSEAPGAPARAAIDLVPGTAWRSAPADGAPALTLDFGRPREFGGLVLDWAAGAAPADYDVEVPDDAGGWRTLRAVRGSDGGRDWLAMGEQESTRLRIRSLGSAPIGLVNVDVKPFDWAATPDALYMEIAHDAPRGHYPRGYLGEQSYWTVIGVDGDADEGLFDEDARLETGRAQFSLEPFVQVGDQLFTWADGRSTASQQDGDLPIPSVRREWPGLRLDVTTFARARGGAPSELVARYVVTNTGTAAANPVLHVAVRPFQVNPPSQFLNVAGGSARIHELSHEGRLLRVNGDRAVIALTPPERFGAMTFDQGDFVAALAAGTLPATDRVVDPNDRASAAMSWTLPLAPGASREIGVVVPMTGVPATLPDALGDAQEAVAAGWRRKLDTVTIHLGGAGADVANTLRAQLAYVLINRDGPGIQPGSRSYERSWIRDGSLSSTALLRMGLTEPVREYLAWYAPHQYADGKVPCCVDRRGSDPVPEHDSHGEFVYLVAEYLRLTGDRALAAELWPHVRSAVAYLDTLRAQRRTAEWRTRQNAPYFGILPPSISHEGYSAKPMHSYWDDLFALRGYQDGVWLAEQIDHPKDAIWMRASRDTFAHDFAAAVRAAMAAHHIDYVPGCSDLGDFDATSTTIAITPVQERGVLPEDAVVRTFRKYWVNFVARMTDTTWDAYTPYEVRTIGSFVHLGWPARADSATNWFLMDRRPPGWHQWAEVVDRRYRHARFLGDMPHTWVGTDFVRSTLDRLAYEREADSALVIAAGVASGWLAGPGVEVRGLRTRWGTLSYTLRREGRNLVASIDPAGLRLPPGGLVIDADRLLGRGGRLRLAGAARGRRVPGGLRVTQLGPSTPGRGVNP